MSFPPEDLYAFLGVDLASATAETLRDAIAAEEKTLTGKHGLSLTDLSRRRSLLLQAKRWLLAPDRKAAYDAHLVSGAPSPTPRKESSAKAPSGGPAVRVAPAAGKRTAPTPVLPAGKGGQSSPNDEAESESSEDSEEGGFDPFSLPVLAGLAVVGVVLAAVGAVVLSWAMSGREVAAPTGETQIADVVAESSQAAVEEPSAEALAAGEDWVRPNLDDELLLLATNAKLIGEGIRVDQADGPPHVENWTGTNALEWRFESTTPAIYRATIEYVSDPASKGGRYQVVVGDTKVVRTVGSGAFAEGANRDEFFIAIKSRGLVTLRIEPVEVLGSELMQFRSLKLSPKQKAAR